MNVRIKKKKQQLSKMHASNWKDLKLRRKRIRADYIESRHRQFRLIPDKDSYAKFIRNRRRYGKIESDVLSAMSCLMKFQAERKEVKKKLFLKEGNCNNGQLET